MSEAKGTTQAELEALLVRLEAHAARLSKNNSNAASTINVNAGGIGVWVAASACAVSVAVTIVAVIFGALVIIDQGRQIGRAQDHLTAIYAMAPHLKPKEDNEHDHHHHATRDQAEAQKRQD